MSLKSALGQQRRYDQRWGASALLPIPDIWPKRPTEAMGHKLTTSPSMSASETDRDPSGYESARCDAKSN